MTGNMLGFALGTSSGGKFWAVDDPTEVEMHLENGVLKNVNTIEWKSDKRCHITHFAYKGASGRWYSKALPGVYLWAGDTYIISKGNLKLELNGETEPVTAVVRKEEFGWQKVKPL